MFMINILSRYYIQACEDVLTRVKGIKVLHRKNQALGHFDTFLN